MLGLFLGKQQLYSVTVVLLCLNRDQDQHRDLATCAIPVQQYWVDECTFVYIEFWTKPKCSQTVELLILSQIRQID